MKSLSEALATATWAEGICKTFGGANWQDLRQELYLYCIDEHFDRAQQAYNAGCLEYFYLRCAINYTRPNGGLRKLYGRGGEQELTEDVCDLPAAEDTPQRCEAEGWEAEKMEAIGEAYASLDWYEQGLVGLFISGWSIREISRRTRITDKEIRRVVREFKARVLARV